MWFPSSRIQTVRSTAWIGQGDKPTHRKVFLVLLEEDGVRYWTGDVHAEKFVGGRPPIAALSVVAKREGLLAARPFTPGQEWDPAARQMALLNADAASRSQLGMGLVQIGWEGGRIVPSAEISLAEQDAQWQGGIVFPDAWTNPLLDWMLRGLVWAREPNLARAIEAKLAAIARQRIEDVERQHQALTSQPEEEEDSESQSASV